MAPGMDPSPSILQSPITPRRKRAQVVRACDWCRKHRVKCDNDQPCLNCRSRGGECSNEAIRASTLPHAYREIDRLRNQVRDLELQLQHARNGPAGMSQHLPSPSHSGLSTPHVLGGLGPNYARQQGYWRGIHIRTARSPNETWYGPSSLYYFVGRVANFLNSTLQQADPAHQMLPKNSSSMLFDSPTGVPVVDAGRRPANPVADSMTPEAYLNPTEEEYFLDLFWQSYHTSLFPILDEAEFKEHYRSLWTTPGSARKPSALVDIVLAICMQHGVSVLPSSRQRAIENNDATISGRQYYRRYRKLAEYETESPTMSTLQCHMLCVIYLCNGSFMNMADAECSLAVRTAYMLGLHTDPPPSEPKRERELRKRVFWSLYMLDAKVGMKLGRPFLLHRASYGPSLPDDGRDVAMLSGSHFAAPGDDATWLSFSLQQAKLFIAARDAHTAFYSKRLDIRDDQTIWDDLDVLEAHVEYMQPYAKAVHDWATGVPSSLQTERQDNGRPLSTDGSALDIEQFAPLWLQRQRLLLELMYHNTCTYMYRPFIIFTHGSPAPALAEKAAATCAIHATALTQILHQVLSSTSILKGWQEAFQWQWNAAVTLVGFVLAYPHGVATPAARSAVDLSVAVFDIFAESFAVAGTAAKIIRELGAKVNFLVGTGREVQGFPRGNWVPSDAAASSVGPQLDGGLLMGSTVVGTGTPYGALDFDFDGVTGASIQDVVQMALAVDQWSGVELLWPPGGPWDGLGPPGP